MADTTEQPSELMVSAWAFNLAAAELAQVRAELAAARAERDAWKQEAHDNREHANQLNEAGYDQNVELFHARQWAAAWKRAAKRWHGIAYETHLTTADVLAHDAAIVRGDNFATEHSRALLRVAALEGLLRRAAKLMAYVWAESVSPAGPSERLWDGGSRLLKEVDTLRDHIDAALGETVVP